MTILADVSGLSFIEVFERKNGILATSLSKETFERLCNRFDLGFIKAITTNRYKEEGDNLIYLVTDELGYIFKHKMDISGIHDSIIKVRGINKLFNLVIADFFEELNECGKPTCDDY